MKKEKLSPEIINGSVSVSNREESCNLIDKNMNIENENICDDLLLDKPEKNKESKCKFFIRLPFICYFLIILFLFSISVLIKLIHFYVTSKENFLIYEKPWIIPELNNRTFENYIFNNGLEVMLIQDPNFDMDGGAILIEDGYLDNPKDEGIASFASHLLTHIAFNDTHKISTLQDYFGTYQFETEEFFTNFRFDILNNGFKKFLSEFSKILSPENIFISDNISKIIKEEIDAEYNDSINIYSQENHLLEYLVYGFKNKSGQEILPHGNMDTLNKYNKDFLEQKVIEYINKLKDPTKIKIVIFSKYKFGISSKYMKKYFENLITMNPPENINKKNNIYKNIELNTSQLIYIKSKFKNSNYIRIIYFINNKNNETYSELYYKKKFFFYIKYFFDDTKKGSLYSLLTNNSKFNIKSIYTEAEIVLKSKIKFIINIELNCLKNINDIIFITYQYMDKIVKEAIGKNIQFDRYKELKDLCHQDQKYKEKTFNTIELAKNNAQNIIDTKWVEKDYFFIYCLPWNETENISEIIKNESYYYFQQLKPENSIIILSLRDKDIDKVTCNNDSKFYLNCTDLMDENNIKKSIYYDINYNTYKFNSSQLEEYLEINNTANITFKENKYKSKNNESFIGLNEDEVEMENLTKNEFNQFYFIRNVNFNIPRVFISINLLHPYLRPKNSFLNETKCYYFQIIEMFSAIKRKINSELADAIRAYNEITFGQDENYLYINVLCYNDVAYKIIQTIRNIIFDTNWESSDLKTNNEIYKNEAYDDFFIFGGSIQDISRYYFYCKLKNSLFNKYEFFPEEFEVLNYEKCIENLKIKNLTTFIVNGYIYGFYTSEEAKKISELFDSEDRSSIFNELLDIVNNDEVNSENFTKWIREIKELNQNQEVSINVKLYNKTENLNYGIRYISFPKDLLLNISIFESILKNTRQEDACRVSSFEKFSYGNIYFELIMYEKDNKQKIPNDKFVQEQWKLMLSKTNEFNNYVDNIGNRYYYIRRNFVLALIKQQTSLQQRATDILKGILYEGTILDPVEIMKEYNEKYENHHSDEEELNYLIKYYSNLTGKNRIDVYTVDK